MKTELKQQAAKGDTQQVLEQLQQLTANDKKLNNEVFLLLTRFYRLKNLERSGITTHEERAAEQNKIDRAIFDLIDELPDNNTAKRHEKPTEKPTDAAPQHATQQGFVQHAEKIINIGHIDNANFS